MAKKSLKPSAYKFGEKNPYNFQELIPFYHDDLKSKIRKKKGGK
ncbi:MAG: hypothetical protein QXT86_13295 [Archaeoglobaceae archaeon]